MSAIDKFPDRRYYSISEVSEHFKVSKSLLRYWEKEFKILKPHKNSKGDRRYTKENVNQIQIIYDLVKIKGFTLKGAEQYIKENKKKVVERQGIIIKLQSIKNNLSKLIDHI